MEAAQAHVVGMGEVGRRLAGALERAGWIVRAVTRHEGWAGALDPADPAPRIVAVREEHLAAVLERLSPLPRGQLVLVQNGFLEPVHGELEPVGRGLVYFTSKGEFYRVLCPSAFHGPHAAPLAAALARGGIASTPIDDAESFRVAMIVKGLWNAVVGLPLAVHGADLATYLRDHRREVEELLDEGARAAGRHYAVPVDPASALRKIDETTVELGWVRGGAKALPWRNGAIAWFGRCHGVPTPVNDRLLRAAGYDPGRSPADSVAAARVSG